MVHVLKPPKSTSNTDSWTKILKRWVFCPYIFYFTEENQHYIILNYTIVVAQVIWVEHLWIFFHHFLAEAGFRSSAEAGEDSGGNDENIVHTQCKLKKCQTWNMYSCFVVTLQIKYIYFCIMHWMTVSFFENV